MEAAAQPIQELLKADSSTEGRAAAVHIIARSDTPVGADTVSVARAASCPEPLPAPGPAGSSGGSTHLLHHLLLKGLARAGVSAAGAVSARAPQKACPEGEDPAPSSPSSTGSTRHLKPLTPAQSGECYRSPTALAGEAFVSKPCLHCGGHACMSGGTLLKGAASAVVHNEVVLVSGPPGASPSLCQSTVDVRNHEERAAVVVVSGAGSMEPLEEDIAPEAGLVEQAACDGASQMPPCKELECDQLECVLSPSSVQLCAGTAEGSQPDGLGLRACAAAGPSPATAPAATAGVDSGAEVPTLAEEVAGGPEAPAGEAGVGAVAAEAAGEAELAVVDARAVEVVVVLADEDGTLLELSKPATIISVDEEVRSQLGEGITSVDVCLQPCAMPILCSFVGLEEGLCAAQRGGAAQWACPLWAALQKGFDV